MGSKLDMLFRKNLYTIAINLIQGQQADAASTADVMRKYGDHLYGKQVSHLAQMSFSVLETSGASLGSCRRVGDFRGRCKQDTACAFLERKPW